MVISDRVEFIKDDQGKRFSFAVLKKKKTQLGENTKIILGRVSKVITGTAADPKII